MGHTLSGIYISEARRRTRDMVVTESSEAAYMDHKSRAAILARIIAAELRDDGAIMLTLVNNGFVLYERAGYQSGRDAVEQTNASGA